MNFDPEYWKVALFGVGVISDENGVIRWNLVAGSIIVASTLGCIGFVVSMSNQLSSTEAQMKSIAEDVKELKNSTHPATSKRYNSEDAARDLDLIRIRIKEVADEMRRHDDDIQRRLQRIEDRLTGKLR